MKQWLGVGVTLLLSLVLMPAYAAKSPVNDEVTVTVRQHQLDGKPAYSYRILNRSKQSILGFGLGGEAASADSRLLGEAPLNNQAPNHWTAQVLQQQPGGFYELRWQPNFWEYRLKQGQQSEEFTLVMTEENKALAKGTWTVLLAGEQGALSGQLQSDEVTPPPKNRKKSRKTKKKEQPAHE